MPGDVAGDRETTSLPNPETALAATFSYISVFLSYPFLYKKCSSSLFLAHVRYNFLGETLLDPPQ